jgi:hypothetical protein
LEEEMSPIMPLVKKCLLAAVVLFCCAMGCQLFNKKQQNPPPPPPATISTPTAQGSLPSVPAPVFPPVPQTSPAPTASIPYPNDVRRYDPLLNSNPPSYDR